MAACSLGREQAAVVQAHGQQSFHPALQLLQHDPEVAVIPATGRKAVM
jgi:hypothetical protein